MNRSWSRRVRLAIALILALMPLLVAIIGPLLAGVTRTRGTAFDARRGMLGTDFAGRDVLREVLLGGAPIVLVTAAATLLTYLVAVPLGLFAAAAGRRWLDELVMRPLDLLLAIPSLLLLILLASIAPPSPVALIGIVVVIMVPDAVRIIRSAALAPASSPAMQVMVLYRETFGRRILGFVGRSIAPVVLADLGVRFIGGLYLVASASFLGIGVTADASSWGVMVDRNRSGLFIQPAATLIPAALIVSMAVGLNLLLDELGQRRPEGNSR